MTTTMDSLSSTGTENAIRRLLDKLVNGEQIIDCRTSLHASDRNEIYYRIRFADNQLFLICLPVEDGDSDEIGVCQAVDGLIANDR